MTYVIEFRYPEGIMYAGLHKGALGWAPTIKTALMFDTPDEAQTMVNNGYGQAQVDYAFVVPIKAGHP